MSKGDTVPSIRYDNKHSGAHVSLAQSINESYREEPMKEEVNYKNGEHAEAEVEVTYLSLSRDEDLASKTISRKNLFLIIRPSCQG